MGRQLGIVYLYSLCTLLQERERMKTTKKEMWGQRKSIKVNYTLIQNRWSNDLEDINAKQYGPLPSFWLCHPACGILVPWPGIEPMHPAMEVWSLNHWTARESPSFFSEAEEVLGRSGLQEQQPCYRLEITGWRTLILIFRNLPTTSKKKKKKSITSFWVGALYLHLILRIWTQISSTLILNAYIHTWVYAQS